MLIRFTDGYLLIPTHEIKSGEPTGTVESIEKVNDVWQRGSILNSSSIQLSEIDTKPKATVLFIYHDHWRLPGAVRQLDYTVANIC